MRKRNGFVWPWLIIVFYFLRGEFEETCQFDQAASLVIACSIMACMYAILQTVFAYIAVLFFFFQDKASAIYPTQRTFSSIYNSSAIFSLQTVLSITTLVLCSIYFPSGKKYFFQIYGVCMYILLSIDSISVFEPRGKTLKQQFLSRKNLVSDGTFVKEKSPDSYGKSSMSSHQPDSFARDSDEVDFTPSFQLQYPIKQDPTYYTKKRKASTDFSIASSEHSAALSISDGYAGYVRFSDELTAKALRERQRIKAVWNKQFLYHRGVHSYSESYYSQSDVGSIAGSVASYSIGGGSIAESIGVGGGSVAESMGIGGGSIAESTGVGGASVGGDSSSWSIWSGDPTKIDNPHFTRQNYYHNGWV